MNIDEVLRTSVGELARGVTPPPPNPERVRARARATRCRQWVATAVGAAAVVVGGVAIAGGLPMQGSTPPVNNPTSSPSTIGHMKGSAVWSDGTSLHVGSREVTVPDQIFGFGLVEDGVVYTVADRGSPVMFQPSDGGHATQIGNNAQLSPVGDPSSGLVSWVEAQGRNGSLVVFDTTSNDEVARTSVPPALGPNDNIIFPGTSTVISVSSTAVYYYGPDGEIWVWRWPAAEAPEFTGQTRDELFDVAGTVTAQAGSKEGSVEFVSADGSTSATAVSPGGYTTWGTSGGYLSPDGNLFASLSDESMPRVLVTDTRTGDTTELDLHSSGEELGFPFAVGWSGNDMLMLKYLSSGEAQGTVLPGHVIACTVSTQTCDVVATVKNGLFVTVPLS